MIRVLTTALSLTVILVAGNACMSQAPATDKPHDHGDAVDQSRYIYRDQMQVPDVVPTRKLAKLELPDRIYHGVLINNDSQTEFTGRYNKYVDTAGRKPSMVGCFHSRWSKGAEQPPHLLLKRLKVIDSVPNVVPFVKMYLGDWWAKGPFMKADDILSGKEDAYLNEMAEDAKTFGKPFMLSINHEMNGNWYTFSENNIVQPTDWTAEKYVKVWRYIYTLFHRQGAVDVAFAWSPGVHGKKFRNYDPLNSYKPYYPGDEYVDWIGCSIYNDVNHYSMDNIAASYPNKPLIVAEWGTEDGPRGKWYRPEPYPGDVKWVEMSFEFFTKRYPNVKAITWFQWGDKCDVQRTPEQAEVYRRGIANPRFLSND